MSALRKLLSCTSGRAVALSSDRRGNVMMILALAIIPLTVSTGAAIDYASAARLQTKLNAAADAAALAAVTQPMMTKSDAEAKTAAVNMFNVQATGLAGLIYDQNKLTVTISTVPGATNSRSATVAYLAKSKNAFAGILGLDTIEIGGSSKANATVAPNIDFYLMIDTSPSMALPATSTGLTKMYNGTGCAFACHQTDLTGADTVKDAQGKNIDFFTYARNNNLVLRTDLVNEAAVDLIDVAKTTAVNNNAKYQMALSNFDVKYYKIIDKPGPPDNVKTQITNAKLLIYCRNNQLVCGVGDADTATRTNLSLDGALNQLPVVPGNGTNEAGDTPQAILFIVTDGARDESRPGSKPEGPWDTTKCTTIKNRGIRIAVLYTEYLVQSLNAKDAATKTWVDNNFRSRIDPKDTLAPALQNCASPGLYYKVTTDGDISAALAALFRQAVATAHLIQ